MTEQAYFKAMDAANYLGISKATFWRWRQKGLIFPVFVEGVQRFRKVDLDKIFEQKNSTHGSEYVKKNY